MTDRSDLSRKLARLADSDELRTPEDGAAAARVIARAPAPHGDPDAVLRGILQTIDDTVLGAKLVFASDADARLSLSVAARRLRKVEAVSDELAADDLVGKGLEPEDSDAQAQLEILVRDFARRARGPVTVSEGPAKAEAGRGLSVARLTDSWGPAADDSDLPPLERFTTRCGAKLTACLIQGDGADRISGETDMQPVLEGLAGVVAPVLGEAGDAPSLALWVRQTGAPDGTAFGLARWPQADGRIIVSILAFATTDTASISAIFRAI